MVAQSDLEGLPKIVRLMDLFNIEIQSLSEGGAVGYYKSKDVEEAKRNRYSIIQWVPTTDSVKYGDV